MKHVRKQDIRLQTKTPINSQVKCNDTFKQKIKVAGKRRDTFAGSPGNFTVTDPDL